MLPANAKRMAFRLFTIGCLDVVSLMDNKTGQQRILDGYPHILSVWEWALTADPSPSLYSALHRNETTYHQDSALLE